MKRTFIPCARLILLGLAVALAIPLSLPGQEAGLDQLALARDFEAHRITSCDPTGGNEDWRDLEPGGTLVLADIRGADSGGSDLARSSVVGFRVWPSANGVVDRRPALVTR